MQEYGHPILPAEKFTPEELASCLDSNADLKKIWTYDVPEFEAVCAERGFKRTVKRDIVSLDLTQSEQELWDDMDGKRRNGIRYAQKHGVVVSLATMDDLDACAHVWIDGYCKKYNWAPEGEDRRVRRWIEEKMLFVARLAETNEAIAISNMRDAHESRIKGVLIYSANASLAEYSKYKPNEILLWDAIKWAKANGYTECCLGNVGSLFKKQFSSKTVAVVEWVRAEA